MWCTLLLPHEISQILFGVELLVDKQKHVYLFLIDIVKNYYIIKEYIHLHTEHTFYLKFENY